jgi:type IV secretory pathway TraG/TraD family ATPase VirD4
MRSNDPDSAEHFAKIIGTRRTEKATERRKKDVIGSANTGDQSIRETEEYVIHPNVFKSELGRGEGVVVIPHEEGRIVRRVKFRMVPDLPTHLMPRRTLPTVDFGERAAVVAEKPTPSKKKAKDKIQAPAGSMSVTAEEIVTPANPKGEPESA